MLLLRKEVSVSTSHALKKLCAAHRNWLRNPKSLLGETIWSNISIIIRFHQNLKSSTNFVEKSLSRVCGLMTKTLTPLELSLYEGYGLSYGLYFSLIPYPCSDGSSSQTYWDFFQNNYLANRKIIYSRSPLFANYFRATKECCY